MKSSSNFCVFINIPIALFAIYSGKSWKVFVGSGVGGERTRGRAIAWLTAIATLLLPYSIHGLYRLWQQLLPELC